LRNSGHAIAAVPNWETLNQVSPSDIDRTFRNGYLGHTVSSFASLSLNYDHHIVGNSMLIHADCLEWMGSIPENSIHGIVTDPPYGVKEYQFDQIEKMANGNGGIWRIPPAFDGCVRSPLPRFTALNQKERDQLYRFFVELGKVATHALRPGGHMFIATNSFLCQSVYCALVEGGLEFRGQLIRVVRTMRGGDRPKNAEEEFPDVCSLPRGGYEPWGILRKPLIAGMKVSDCLRRFETGGLRRLPENLPFSDLIQSTRTSKEERRIADHPSLKPQALLRELVYTVLPLGKGIVLDPFAGSASTIAAAEALGVTAIGIEKSRDYYEKGRKNVKPLSLLSCERDQINFAFQ
jgi:site-specific DNA-methyltransferase (adenine-specific)